MRTALNVAGGRDGDWSFRTVARPKAGLQSGGGRLPRTLAAQLFGQRGKPPRGSVPRYRSAPNLRPPEVQITRRARQGTGEGLIFMSPKKVFGARVRARRAERAAAVRQPRRAGVVREPHRRQRQRLPDADYKGRPVITLVAGPPDPRHGRGHGDAARPDVPAGQAHPRGQRLRVRLPRVDDHRPGHVPRPRLQPGRRDLRSVGGPRNGRVVDSVVQEIDIETGRVMFEWHSLAHVPLKDSFAPHSRQPRGLYDYFHINSVREDTDGNLIVSGRETHGRLQDRPHDRQGHVDARAASPTTSSSPRGTRSRSSTTPSATRTGRSAIFDNEAAPRVRRQSRVIWYRLDEKPGARRSPASSATPTAVVGHPGQRPAPAERQHVHRLGLAGLLHRDRPAATGCCRRPRRARQRHATAPTASRGPATPREKPALAAERRGSRPPSGRAGTARPGSRRWEVLAGDSARRAGPGRRGRRTGFETGISVPTTKPFIAVRAKDAGGQVLGDVGRRAGRAARASRGRARSELRRRRRDRDAERPLVQRRRGGSR